jgi:tRNA dimethylallyltransferase
MEKPKILVILGPTATGKSALAVEIAKKFNSEIVSADSRQVYIGLDIGTGKITNKEMEGIPHHLIDIVKPDEDFSVQKFKKLAEVKIDEILSRKKLPIIVGGTGFYIQAIVDGLVLPEVPPNKKLREELESKSVEELNKILENLNSKSSTMIYHGGESANKRRVIRAIEIVKALGEIPKLQKNPKYEALQIGLNLDGQSVRSRISHRLKERINTGMIGEGKKIAKKIGYERMIKLGLEYKFLALYLKGEMSEIDMIEKLEIAINQYAKRQRTWFKRDGRIKWFRPDQKKEVFEGIRRFLEL